MDAPSVWGAGTIGYDGRGNVLSQSLGPSINYAYTYDGAGTNRLVSVSGNRVLTLSYDVYGNAIANGEDSFTYDDASLLRCYRCGTADQIDYDYDGRGQRARAVKAGVNTYTFHDSQGRLLFEYEAASGYTNYVYLGDKLIAKSRPAGTIHYHNDLLGSPIAATDEAGNLLWKENYRPWGRQILQGSTATGNTLWYGGKPHDFETKLSYLGARYYDVVIGRFMAVDPAPFDETNPLHSLNRYAYANNNPFKFKDPKGEVPLLILFAPVIASATGAAISGAINAAYQYASTGSVQWSGIGGVLDAAGEGAIFGLLGAGAAARGAPAQTSGGAAPVLQGQRAVDRAIADLASEGREVVGRNITIETSLGRRVTDIISRGEGGLKGHEVKSGGSRYPSSQKAKDAEIECLGGCAVGKKAEDAGLSGRVQFPTELRRYPGE